MANKPLIVIAVITLLIIVGGALLFTKNQKVASLPSSYEYFWGEGCPHCENVEKFLESWDKKDKITIDKKEVWNNRENANLMTQRASYCKLNTATIGVPFMFTPNGKCLSGDEPIIGFFKSLVL